VVEVERQVVEVLEVTATLYLENHQAAIQALKAH
jgi:hypothetical protein